MVATLDGVRTKIARAQRHVDELKAALRSEVGNTRVALREIEELPEGRRATGTITLVEPPRSIGVHVGDAAHNLRSALDHLVCQLAIAAGNPSACDRKTMFPIYADAAQQNFVDKWVKAIDPVAQAAIRILQPYVRRPTAPTSDPLWILSELDNIDKHRLLLVANPKMAELRLTVTVDGEARTFSVSNNPKWQTLKQDSIPFRFIVPWDTSGKPQTKVNVLAEPMIGVVFARTGLACDGKEVIPTLRSLISEVVTIVDEFERRFFLTGSSVASAQQ